VSTFEVRIRMQSRAGKSGLSDEGSLSEDGRADSHFSCKTKPFGGFSSLYSGGFFRLV
jgi:hypothetical protein